MAATKAKTNARWRTSGAMAPVRVDPFAGRRFSPNPVPRTPGSVFPQGVDLAAPKPGPTPISLGQGMTPDFSGNPMAGPPQPARTRLWGPGSLAESTSAPGTPRRVPMSGGAPYSSLGQRMAADAPKGWGTVGRTTAGDVGRLARGAGSSALGNPLIRAGGWAEAGGLKGLTSGVARRGAGLLALPAWDFATNRAAEALGGDDRAAGQFMQGANVGGTAALLAGRNPLTAPVTLGAGIAEGIANTGWGNDLINAIRPDSMGDIAEGYGLTDTLGHVGGQIMGALGIGSDSGASKEPDVPIRTRINEFAQSRNIDPAYMSEINTALDDARAQYEQFPELLPAGEDGKPMKLEDAMHQEELAAAQAVMGWEDQQAARDQQFAEMAAAQSFIGQAMRPYQEQMDQSGQLMAAAWKNYSSGAPSWMQPYATFQSEQAAASGKRLSAAYAQQAAMIPAMAQMDSAQGRQSMIDNALWQQQMGPLYGGGQAAPQTLDDLTMPGG